MAITSARMQMRRGLEADFDPDKMQPGEWAVSTDEKYVRMCFSPGVCVRMATYDAFEEDMEQIKEILSTCETIEEAVSKINTEVSANAQAVEEYTEQAKQYRDEAEQFRNEAESIVGVGVRQINSDIALNRQTLGYAKKNLLENTATSQAVNGITFTVNADGSVTANGTATYNAILTINQKVILEEGKQYVASCEGSREYNPNTEFWWFLYDNTEQKDIANATTPSFTFNGNDFLFRVFVKKDAVINNLTIYPMIRLASDTDSTYEPYVDDVDTRLKSLESGSGGSGGTAGTTNYELLNNKPSINNVELSGNKTTSDLGITAESIGADAAGSASAALSNAKDYTDAKISDLVGGAPSTLDTLKEISDALEESGEAVEAINQSIGNKLDKAGDSKDNTVTFTQASTRENIASTEKHSTLFGKIAKWFADLKTVAFSGSYNDLSNKPTIPTVNNATLTIQKNGSNVQTFTANASSDKTANITVPTKTSELENDSGFLSSATALDTYEEIMANTQSGKFAGAKGVKEGFSKINDSLQWWIDNGYLPDINNPIIALVPIMTSDTTPSGQVIYSGYYTNQQAWKAFDNNNSTTWSSAANTTPQYIGYKFTSQKTVTRVDITKRVGQVSTMTCKLQGSNNGTDWVDIGDSFTHTTSSTSATIDTYNFNNSTPYLYYRIYITANNLTSQNPTFTEIQFYGF